MQSYMMQFSIVGIAFVVQPDAPCKAIKALFAIAVYDGVLDAVPDHCCPIEWASQGAFSVSLTNILNHN